MAKSNTGKKKKVNNNLTLNKLKDINKKFKDTVEIDVDGYKVKIYQNWDQGKIDDLIIEATMNARDNKSVMTDEFLVKYLYFLAIRHFTSLEIPESFQKQISWMEELVKPGYYKKIVENLPAEEMARVFNQIDETATQSEEVRREVLDRAADMELEPEVMDYIDEQLENDEPIEDIEVEEESVESE